ncbi:hypothetical protein [Geobacter sp. AOG2]|uniref:hypothetical protein n=1 Tax=Geobacter sp. AOG2 TaxID=1566347 RepID=UPI001CC419FA|nr:hypothetical protein [Geobacter sp. AOG2]GFE61451.1 hypothetical protein AOG2_20380 [Geobacter sp. AOG2]
MVFPCFKAAGILLVEDNPSDVSLLMEPPKGLKPFNNINMVEAGSRAVTFLCCRRVDTPAALKLTEM